MLRKRLEVEYDNKGLEHSVPARDAHKTSVHACVWQAIELHGEHDQGVPGAAAEITARATASLEVTFLNSAVDFVGEVMLEEDDL